MAGQDEIRRLMKEAKHQTKTKTKTSVGTGPSSASRSLAAPKSASKAARNEAQKAIPAGFFDDSLADAKARNVDVKQLAEKQQAADWEAFQEFADEVEQQTAKEQQEQGEETKEREAEEQLEHMQYLDRYRLALECAATLRPNGKDKRKLQGSSDGEDEEQEVGAIAVAVNQVKKQKRLKKRQDSHSDDEFDPCNWRARGI